ncbi:MAG TPA: addiction module protein [Verrucomicrobiae bacterium]|nr:addiction module protein [Verrucomicrobiae bacterium]
MSAAELSKAALELPADERLELARRLMESVAAPAALKDAVTEGVQRIESVAAGHVKGLTEEQFLARLRSIYGNKTTGDSQSLISELRGDR